MKNCLYFKLPVFNEILMKFNEKLHIFNEILMESDEKLPLFQIVYI